MDKQKKFKTHAHTYNACANFTNANQQQQQQQENGHFEIKSTNMLVMETKKI